ncbi:MFS transporter [Pseudalkalibacillus decolorationis]|uniref:MFS transporter n=1 Tax=Pseudalkalibacillus decolorationis TaxID=163879 RepID=UPI0021479CE6|nr:MFS transporter [Pseudalkalibacillus decolorationis]
MKTDTNLSMDDNRLSKDGWKVMILLFILQVINFGDKAVIGFASVPIIKEFGLTSVQWGLIGSAFFWLFSVSSIIGGALSDYTGTKRVLSVMGAVWSVIQFATLFAFSFPYLLITRVILGAGEGPALAVAFSQANKWLPRHRVGIGLAMLVVAGSLGPAIFAPLFTHLISSYGWRSAFLAMGIIGVTWLVLWMWLAKERPESVDMSDLKPNAKKESHSASWSEVFPTFRSKNFILITLCGFAAYCGVALNLFWVPNYLVNVHGVNAGFVAMIWIVAALGQVGFGALSDRIYQKTQSIRKSRVHLLGPLMILVGICYYLAAVIDSGWLALIFLSLAALYAVWFSVGPNIAMELVPPEHHGKVTGTLMALVTLGGIIAPYATGWIVENSANQAEGFSHMFQLVALMFLIFGGLLWIGVRPKERTIESDSLQSVYYAERSNKADSHL